MRRPMGSPAAAGLMAAFLIALSAPAQAGEPDLQAEERRDRNRELLRLATRSSWQLEEPEPIQRSNAFEFDRRGVRFRSDFAIGNREVEFRVGGPIYKAIRQKRFGITLEFRF